MCAELFPCSSCDEIKAKKPDACSGDFVIMLADGMLEQASILLKYPEYLLTIRLCCCSNRPHYGSCPSVNCIQQFLLSPYVTKGKE